MAKSQSRLEVDMHMASLVFAHFGGKMPNRHIHAWAEHDAWCKCTSGGSCTCNPDFFLDDGGPGGPKRLRSQ